MYINSTKFPSYEGGEFCILVGTFYNFYGFFAVVGLLNLEDIGLIVGI